MTSQKNKQIYLSLMNRQNDLDENSIEPFMKEFYTHDFVQHQFGYIQGDIYLPAFLEEGFKFLRDYEDFHYVVDDIFAEGDRVACRGIARATRKDGEGSLYVTFLTVARFDGLKVAEEWQYTANLAVSETAGLNLDGTK